MESNTAPLLEMRGIKKDFFGNQVLTDINFTLKAGEVLGLAGENGAGKSTLMKILFGMDVIRETGGYGGDVLINGEKVTFNTPFDALEAGIGMVHQEFSLIPGFTATENILLNREPQKKNVISEVFGPRLNTLDYKKMKTKAAEAIDKMGVEIDQNMVISDMPVGHKQFTEIARELSKDQLKLLSDTVAKADNATIANPHIDSVKTVEGVAKVNVTYSLNGKNVNDSLTINKDGSKFLLFPNWKISSPLLKTITVSVPNAVESLSVNGVDVTAKNAEKSDSGTWTLRVYPGSYKVSIGKSGYVTSGITMVRTNADSDAADLKIMPTAKLKEDLSKAVNAKLDECAKSTDYAPEGCPFGFDLYDEDYYRNFAWSISVYPKLSDIDLDYGTFSTRQGKAKCTYEEKNFDDSWESQDNSTHFTVNGSFSIRDGKLSVTIDDED